MPRTFSGNQTLLVNTGRVYLNAAPVYLNTARVYQRCQTCRKACPLSAQQKGASARRRSLYSVHPFSQICNPTERRIQLYSYIIQVSNHPIYRLKHPFSRICNPAAVSWGICNPPACGQVANDEGLQIPLFKCSRIANPPEREHLYGWQTARTVCPPQRRPSV